MNQTIPSSSTSGPNLHGRRSILTSVVMCVAVLLGVFAGGVVIAFPSVDLAVWYALLFGFPLSFVIGKVALSRIRGTPLGRSELQTLGVRVWVTMFVLLVVAPVVIVVGILLMLTLGIRLGMWLGEPFSLLFLWCLGPIHP